MTCKKILHQYNHTVNVIQLITIKVSTILRRPWCLFSLYNNHLYNNELFSLLMSQLLRRQRDDFVSKLYWLVAFTNFLVFERRSQKVLTRSEPGTVRRNLRVADTRMRCQCKNFTCCCQRRCLSYTIAKLAASFCEKSSVLFVFELCKVYIPYVQYYMSMDVYINIFP